MKKAHADMNVDEVHDMMDDIAEQQDVAKEISEAISSPVAFGQDFDEDELEAELNDLEEEGEKQLLDSEPAKLPDVPAAEPPAATKVKPQKEEEDPDMAELAAWAS